MSYDVIDADGHVLEPPDLWARYMEPKHRNAAPRLVRTPDGGETFAIEGGDTINLRPIRRGDQPLKLGFAGGIGARTTGLDPSKIPYAEGKPGGFDPHKRIPDMDAEGIDAAVLYPTLGLFLGATKDPDFSADAARAYNRWLADYCKPYPNRLFGAAMLPLQSVTHAVQEMNFAANHLGFRAAFVRPNPYNGRALHDAANDPIWRSAQELDLAIGIHSGSESGQQTVAVDRFTDRRAVRHLVAHTFEMEAAAISMIMCGVCDRFPRLRVAFLESGGGWMAGLLDRMDRHFDDVWMNDTKLSARPSEIFRRQCYISFDLSKARSSISPGI